jgi:hypothetical protein
MSIPSHRQEADRPENKRWRVTRFGLRFGGLLHRIGGLPGTLCGPAPVGGSHLRLPGMKTSVCVSTVSIVGGRDGGLPDWAREIAEKVVVTDIIGRSRPRLS